MSFVAIICFFLFIAVLFRYLLLCRDTNNLKEQLKAINHRSQTNQLVTNPHQFKELSELIQEINKEISSKTLAIEELEQRERQIKEQFTNISHDLRTPLASLLGYLTLLEEENAESEKNRYRQLIQEKARHLQTLIDTYYDFAKIESFDLQLVMTTIDINQLLPQLLATYYTQFKQDCILPDITLPTESWLILADEQALQRVFSNLIENCLKYGQQSFVITCNSKRQLVLQNQIKDFSSLEIEHVFQRLYTADTTRNLQSTGLGLTVAKQLLEQMGHSIGASLEGNWFTITITWHK